MNVSSVQSPDERFSVRSLGVTGTGVRGLVAGEAAALALLGALPIRLGMVNMSMGAGGEVIPSFSFLLFQFIWIHALVPNCDDINFIF